MKSLNKLIPLGVFVLGCVAASGAAAQAGMAGGKAGDKKTQQSAVTEMADGEVRKVDKGAGKITIKHGEIKNLDMPPMTMVFQAKDPAMLEKVQKGDKVKFRATMAGSAMVVTEINLAK